MSSLQSPQLPTQFPSGILWHPNPHRHGSLMNSIPVLMDGSEGDFHDAVCLLKLGEDVGPEAESAEVVDGYDRLSVSDLPDRLDHLSSRSIGWRDRRRLTDEFNRRAEEARR